MFTPNALSRYGTSPAANPPLLVSVLRDGLDILDIILPPAAAQAAGQALYELHRIWCRHARRPFRAGSGAQVSADEAAMVALFGAIARNDTAHVDALLLWLLRPQGRAEARKHTGRLARALARAVANDMT